MKVVYLANIFILGTALLLNACTATRTSTQSEYDDLYYTAEDRQAEVQLLTQAKQSAAEEEGYPDRTTNPDYYAEEKVNEDPTWEDNTQAYGSTMYYGNNRYHPFAQGSQNMYYDPYYADWQYQNQGMFHDPYYADWQYQNQYWNNAYAGGYPYWYSFNGSNGWLVPPNYGYRYPYLYSGYNSPFYYGAYNRGFHHGYNWYWYNRSLADYVIINSRNDREISRGRRQERGDRNTRVTDSRRGRSNTNTRQEETISNQGRRSNDAFRDAGRSTYTDRSQRTRSRSYGTNQRSTQQRSSGSYNRRDNRSSDSFNRDSSRSGSRSSRSGRSSGRSRRDD